jgi:hypothetical protein
MWPDIEAIQSDIWEVGGTTATNNITSHSDSSVVLALQACVQQPFALLSGTINISRNGIIFDISCSNCNLTSCVKLQLHKWQPTYRRTKPLYLGT